MHAAVNFNVKARIAANIHNDRRHAHVACFFNALTGTTICTSTDYSFQSHRSRTIGLLR